MNYPKKAAYKLAQQMKEFRVKTEETQYSEINQRADLDRAEVVRQMDWTKYHEVIEYLEFCYLMDKKKKG